MSEEPRIWKAVRQNSSATKPRGADRKPTCVRRRSDRNRRSNDLFCAKAGISGYFCEQVGSNLFSLRNSCYSGEYKIVYEKKPECPTLQGGDEWLWGFGGSFPHWGVSRPQVKRAFSLGIEFIYCCLCIFFSWSKNRRRKTRLVGRVRVMLCLKA